jgi:phage-related protein
LTRCVKFGTIAYDRPFQEATGILLRNAGWQPTRQGLDQGTLVRRSHLVGRDVQKVEFGWPIGMPYCRSLGNGLWEVRSDLTDGKIGRVIFCVVRGRMVLLHGFVKKTRKTPAKDMELALKRMKEVE